MDGVDKMSKAELTLLCEKHKVDGGKTVGQMRYALKKFLEDEESRAPSSKKHKAELLSLKPTITKATTTTIITATSSSDSSSGAAGSGACPLGESCPQLHSYSHRCKLKHGAEYRDVPFICRDGLSCSKLHDKEHAKKYAHEDSLDKVCKLGAECPELHLLEHRRQYEHPGFRAQPFPCRDGMGCAMLKDRAHHRCCYRSTVRHLRTSDWSFARTPFLLRSPPTAPNFGTWRKNSTQTYKAGTTTTS